MSCSPGRFLQKTVYQSRLLVSLERLFSKNNTALQHVAFAPTHFRLRVLICSSNYSSFNLLCPNPFYGQISNTTLSPHYPILGKWVSLKVTYVERSPYFLLRYTRNSAIIGTDTCKVGITTFVYHHSKVFRRSSLNNFLVPKMPVMVSHSDTTSSISL